MVSRRRGRAAVVLLAGGSGTRVGAGLNKVYLPLAGRRVVSWSLAWAGELAEVGQVVLVVREQDAELARQTLRRDAGGIDVRLVVGGSTRHESEDCAFADLSPSVQDGEIDVIAVHDAARPLAGPALFRSVITTAAAVGGALPAVPAVGVLPVGVLPVGLDGRPGGLVRVQTPQAFRAEDLIAAYAAAHRDGFQGTDTAASVEAYSALPVHAVPGSGTNIKVTYPADLVLAERLLAANHYRLV